MTIVLPEGYKHPAPAQVGDQVLISFPNIDDDREETGQVVEIQGSEWFRDLVVEWQGIKILFLACDGYYGPVDWFETVRAARDVQRLQEQGLFWEVYYSRDYHDYLVEGDEPHWKI